MKNYLAALLFTISFPVAAQTSFTKWLQLAAQDPEVVKLTKQIEFLNLKQYKLAPIQKLEFRTESNQLDPTRQEYAIRINPANPWEMHAQNRFFDQLKKQYELEKELTLEKHLAERYISIIDLIVTREKVLVRQNELTLTRQLLATIEKQNQSDYFDAEKYFDLVVKEIEVQEELEESMTELKMLEQSFINLKELVHNSSIESFVSMQQVDSVLHDSLAPLSRLIQLTELKDKSNAASITLEKSNINVGYVQAQYQEFRIEQGRRPWNIGLGITIPIFNPNKQNITKRNLARIEDTHETSRDVLEQQLAASELYQSLQGLLERQSQLQKRKMEIETSKIQNLLVVYGNSNPAIGLKVKLQFAKLEILDLALKQKIWTDYILWLKTTNRLLQFPCQNMLSAKHETLEF